MAAQTVRTCDFARSLTSARPILCGATVLEPTVFCWAGKWLSIDLCPDHRQHVEQVTLAPVLALAKATVPGGQVNPNARKVYQAAGGQLTFTSLDVRRWLQEQHREAPQAGRLNESLIKEYAAHLESELVSA